MTSLDPILRQKLRDLGRALSAAISDSGEASRRLNELRDEGYSLYLLVDGSESSEPTHGGEPLTGESSDDEAAGGETGERPRRHAPGARKPDRQPAARRLPAPRGEPVFRINGEDVSFLRSVGIDPTRPGRRRRSNDG
ncbi:MAG TPA: hypothetical protein VKU40_15140 [Thermoanaerobaculia bacterium]|nr:hypothetical protein [Thermoanaerobaculia bacterium]